MPLFGAKKVVEPPPPPPSLLEKVLAPIQVYIPSSSTLVYILTSLIVVFSVILSSYVAYVHWQNSSMLLAKEDKQEVPKEAAGKEVVEQVFKKAEDEVTELTIELSSSASSSSDVTPGENEDASASSGDDSDNAAYNDDDDDDQSVEHTYEEFQKELSNSQDQLEAPVAEVAKAPEEVEIETDVASDAKPSQKEEEASMPTDEAPAEPSKDEVSVRAPETLSDDNEITPPLKEEAQSDSDDNEITPPLKEEAQLESPPQEEAPTSLTQEVEPTKKAGVDDDANETVAFAPTSSTDDTSTTSSPSRRKNLGKAISSKIKRNMSSSSLKRSLSFNRLGAAKKASA